MNLKTYTLIKNNNDENDTVEIIRHVKLTDKEAKTFNFAFALNNTNFKYIKLL